MKEDQAQFVKLVSEGRRFCYHALVDGHTVAVVVENEPGLFTTAYHFPTAKEQQGFVKMMNERLNLTHDEAALIVCSSMAVSNIR